MPAAATQTANSLWSGIVSGFTQFMNFIPTLLGVIVLLVVGWFVAKLIARLIAGVLHAVKVDHWSDRAGVSQYLPKTDRGRITFSGVISTLAKWFIYLIFIQAAANLLGM